MPWRFLISSVHVALEADRFAAQSAISTLEVRIARGSDGALGIDFDEENVIRRVGIGSPAAAAGIEPGDLVTGVNGNALEGRRLMELLDPHAGAFLLSLTRGLYDPEQAGLDVMSTLRLAQHAAGRSGGSGRAHVEGVEYVSVVPGRDPLSPRQDGGGALSGSGGGAEHSAMERVQQGAVMRQVLPSAESHQHSVLSTQPSAKSHQSSAIRHHPSSIIHQPSVISHQPSAISHHPSSIIHHPPSIIHHPSTIRHQPSAISPQPSAISHLQSAISNGNLRCDAAGPPISHQSSAISHQHPEPSFGRSGVLWWCGGVRRGWAST